MIPILMMLIKCDHVHQQPGGCSLLLEAQEKVNYSLILFAFSLTILSFSIANLPQDKPRIGGD